MSTDGKIDGWGLRIWVRYLARDGTVPHRTNDEAQPNGWASRRWQGHGDLNPGPADLEGATPSGYGV